MGLFCSHSCILGNANTFSFKALNEGYRSKDSLPNISSKFSSDTANTKSVHVLLKKNFSVKCVYNLCWLFLAKLKLNVRITTVLYRLVGKSRKIAGVFENFECQLTNGRIVRYAGYGFSGLNTKVRNRILSYMELPLSVSLRSGSTKIRKGPSICMSIHSSLQLESTPMRAFLHERNYALYPYYHVTCVHSLLVTAVLNLNKITQHVPIDPSITIDVIENAALIKQLQDDLRRTGGIKRILSLTFCIGISFLTKVKSKNGGRY
ncbi:hypothetical protein C0J52_12655 [Blattella germanica]|nr:hypothetical protein C0J52_12655 [Blattella germanica]